MNTIRKGATGTAALALTTIFCDILGLALTYLGGAFLLPLAGQVIPALAAPLLERLRHDLWLFLTLMFLLAIFVVSGLRYTFDIERSRKERARQFGELMGGSTLILGILCLVFELLFQIKITLGFITPATTTFSLDRLALREYIAKPNFLLANILLGYYLLVHLVCLADRTPKKDPATPALPLAYPVPDGPHARYIQQCFQRLEQALMAWDPPPVTWVKWPKIAYFEGNGKMFWHWRTLVVPEKLLDPTNAEIFLPALARELARYNGPDWWMSRLMRSYPRSGGWMLFLGLTANWLWLPGIISKGWWDHWHDERTLDRDAFVHSAGQGEWLIHFLRKRRFQLQEAGQPDTSWPPLMERIDHLQMLLDREAKQMKNQNIKPAAPLLAKSETRTPKQIKPRRKAE